MLLPPCNALSGVPGVGRHANAMCCTDWTALFDWDRRALTAWPPCPAVRIHHVYVLPWRCPADAAPMRRAHSGAAVQTPPAALAASGPDPGARVQAGRPARAPHPSVFRFSLPIHSMGGMGLTCFSLFIRPQDAPRPFGKPCPAGQTLGQSNGKGRLIDWPDVRLRAAAAA